MGSPNMLHGELLKEKIQEAVVTTLKNSIAKITLEIERKIMRIVEKQMSHVDDRCSLLEQRLRALSGELVRVRDSVKEMESDVHADASGTKFSVLENNIHILAEKTEETFQDFDVHMQELIEERLNCVRKDLRSLEEMLDSKVELIEQLLGDREAAINSYGSALRSIESSLQGDYRKVVHELQCRWEEVLRKVEEIEEKSTKTIEASKHLTSLSNSLGQIRHDLDVLRRKSDTNKAVAKIGNIQKHMMSEMKNLSGRIDELEVVLLKEERNFNQEDFRKNVDDLKKSIQKTLKNVNIETNLKETILEATGELRNNLNSERYKAGTRAVQNQLILMDISEKLDALTKQLFLKASR